MNKSETLFSNLGLKRQILMALEDLGYIKPSPIQEACIPHLLNGKDVLGIAQTGSGKTAAFFLPMLNNIDPNLLATQILILAPTRELVIQIKDVCINFAKYIENINITSIYGGQQYKIQFRELKQGSQVVIGTPGRLLDHLNRNTLNLSNLRGFILDEADEMLKMGFIEDIKNILKRVPKKHQTALFSATMSKEIFYISKFFTKDPKEIRINSNIVNKPNIHQRYWIVKNVCKSEALLRFLETEDFDAVIVFVGTKIKTLELYKNLEKSGYNIAFLNGDMNQTVREKIIDNLRNGQIDILVTTDVAARGLDINRINLVINYDIPIDPKYYIHRIGRTGRAGRSGKAIMFVENYEKRLLENIKHYENLYIKEISLPTDEEVKIHRLSKFIFKIRDCLKSKDLLEYRNILDIIKSQISIDTDTLNSALLKIAFDMLKYRIIDPISEKNLCPYERKINIKDKNRCAVFYNDRKKHIRNSNIYRIEIGKNDGVKTNNIIKAITSRLNISTKNIGNIKLFNSYSTVELPNYISNKILSSINFTDILNKSVRFRLLSRIKDKKVI